MKTWMIGAVAAGALLAGCGGNETAEAPARQAQSTAPSADELSLLQFTLRDGDASEAPAALRAMSLHESGAGRLSFADRAVSGAAATFSNVEVSIEDEDPPLKIGSLAFEGLETGEDGAANFSQITASDLSIVTSEDDDEQGEIKIGQIMLVNPSPELGAWVASLFGDEEPGPFPDADKVVFDAFRVGGIDMNVEDDGETVALSLASLTFNGKAEERLNGAVLSGLSVDVDSDDESVDMSIESIAVAGAALGFIADLQEAAASGDEDDLAAMLTASAYQDPVEPGYDSVTISGMSLDASGVKFDLPSASSRVERNKAGQAVRVITDPFRATLSADASGEAGAELAGPLEQLGYEELTLTGEGLTEYDPETDVLTYVADKNYLALENGLTMRMGGKLEGYSAALQNMGEIDPEAEDGGQGQVFEALSNLKIHKMDLTFVDQSLMERAFKLAGQMMDQEPEAVRGQAQMSVGILPLMAGEIGLDPTILADTSAALAQFISKPGELTIKLDPKTPFTPASFADPSTITKESLGFSIKATPPAEE